MAFKVFTAYGAASRPEATLRASGYLFISKGIMRRAGCENAAHAQLMYDEIEFRLGIRLYEDAPVDDGSVRDVISEKSGIAMSLAPLLRYYGFPEPKKLGKRVLQVSLQDKLIVLDLTALRQTKAESGRGSKSASATASASEEFDDDIPF
jgi:hypothetical protein